MSSTKLAGQKLLRKLTLRTVVGSKADILAIAQGGRVKPTDVVGEPVPVLRVVGQVNGYKAGQSDYGDYVELKGAFQAVNLVTGEVTDGVSTAILPDVVGNALAQAIKGGAEAAEFAVEVDVTYVEKAATMYEFSVRTLVKPQTAAPVAGILARLESAGITMTAPKQLAAPKLSDADRAKQAKAEAEADAKRSKDKGKETAKT